jgi:bifunctional DNA-binding transcriptional regulator/antitoxin component of YhaV-PrlF toxin-antitoxin module
MEILTLGKEGQISLPDSILRRLRLPPDTMLTAEVTGDGGILLRVAEDSLIEMHDDERLAEFAEENRLTEDQRRRVDEALGRKM